MKIKWKKLVVNISPLIRSEANIDLVVWIADSRSILSSDLYTWLNEFSFALFPLIGNSWERTLINYRSGIYA